MLDQFLKEHKKIILDMTEKKTLVMAGVRPSSEQLRAGLPFFFNQLVSTLNSVKNSPVDRIQIEEPLVKKAAGELGTEMLRIGFTLSNVVHFYGGLCQSITELATELGFSISAHEFHDLNRCLDDAIADAVTEYQRLRESQTRLSEVKRCGFCAHELRNSLGTAMMSFEMIKTGKVGLSGSLGHVVERSFKRMGELIGRSLTEVKLAGGSPSLDLQSVNILLLVDQMLLTANREAKKRKQSIEVQINSDLVVEADLQFLYSALSNLIQNALKYTHDNGRIQIRAYSLSEMVVIEVEDECGGIAAKTSEDLFGPFEQHNENRKGLGLGLTLARKAVELHHGIIEVDNLPQKGCIFKITLPVKYKPL
jgi:signal transduction histidine kinase